MIVGNLCLCQIIRLYYYRIIVPQHSTIIYKTWMMVVDNDGVICQCKIVGLVLFYVFNWNL